MFQHNIVYGLANRHSIEVVCLCYNIQNPTWYNNHVQYCCNIAVQSCYFIIPWQHVLSCMNMAVDLSWWLQQRSSLFVHQAMNSLFLHVWTSLSTTLFKLASSAMFKPGNRQKQPVRFYVCRCENMLRWEDMLKRFSSPNHFKFPWSCVRKKKGLFLRDNIISCGGEGGL